MWINFTSIFLLKTSRLCFAVGWGSPDKIQYQYPMKFLPHMGLPWFATQEITYRLLGESPMIVAYKQPISW